MNPKNPQCSECGKRMRGIIRCQSLQYVNIGEIRLAQTANIHWCPDCSDLRDVSTPTGAAFAKVREAEDKPCVNGTKAT